MKQKLEEIPRSAAQCSRYKSPSNNSFLHQFAYHGSRIMAFMFIRLGAQLDLRNEDGLTPGDMARKYQHFSLAADLDAAASVYAGPEYAFQPQCEYLASSFSWKEHTPVRAESELKVGFHPDGVLIKKNQVYFVDRFGRALVGSKGSLYIPQIHATNPSFDPFTAVRNRCLSCLKASMAADKNKENINSLTDENGCHLLYHACFVGFLEGIKYLADSKASLTVMSGKYGSLNSAPLYIACQLNRGKCTKMLLELKADIAQGALNGLKPLHVASVLGNVECVNVLLNHKANVNEGAPFRGIAKCDPLVMACFGAEPSDDAKRRIEVLAESSDRNYNEKRRAEVIRTLAEHKADVNQYLPNGDYLLYHATTPLIIEALVDKKANVNGKNMVMNRLTNWWYPNIQGDTPLIRAAEEGRTESVECLLRLGRIDLFVDVFACIHHEYLARRIKFWAATLVLYYN